ncbi:hypothetical protein FJ365_05765 [Candidatus Dependentiae bacterium]|nr:hypothetical protein [Candidatus Dependentiae bacterium]
MNIKDFASKPQLVELILDDKDLVERYGEPITFHTYNIVRMSTYFDFFNARSNNEFGNLDKIMKGLILDGKGNRVLSDDEDLPIDIAAAAINKIGEILGKPQSKASTPMTGDQQK